MILRYNHKYMDKKEFKVENTNNLLKISIVGEDSYILAEKINNNTYNGIKTSVQSQSRGNGVGKQLVEQLAIWLRKNNAKLVPTCPFIARVVEDEKYKDILKK